MTDEITVRRTAPGPNDTGFEIDQDSAPYTHLSFKNDPDEFQFAIVSDNSGSARPGVFSAGLEMGNLRTSCSPSSCSVSATSLRATWTRTVSPQPR